MRFQLVAPLLVEAVALAPLAPAGGIGVDDLRDPGRSG